MTTTKAQDRTTSNLSFQQKSTLASLIVLLSTAIYYFARLFELVPIDSFTPFNMAVPGGYWQLVVTTLLLIIIAEATLQALLAIVVGKAAPPTKQERDIALKATRNAYMLLTVGVMLTLISFVAGLASFVIANGLLLFFVLAEIGKLVSQLIYFRLK